MTIFGDVVSQHGEWIWLGSLIELLQPLGFSERLVRTSVFRLVQEDWLAVKKVGRKSYYQFTNTANNHYTKAARRIYSKKQAVSDDQWLILFSTFVADDLQTKLKRQLKWLGFSSLSSGVYAHPSIDRQSLEETILELELVDSVMVFSAKTVDPSSQQVLKKLVFEKWNLQSLQQSYKQFVATYRQLLTTFEVDNKLTCDNVFLLRCLLIHEYRRILLQDHELADAMLPADWEGNIAKQLTAQLYKKLMNKSILFITTTLQSDRGLLPPASTEFSQRFN